MGKTKPYPRGVRKVGNRYKAQITVDGEAHHAYFDTLGEAISQRAAWEAELGKPLWGAAHDVTAIGQTYGDWTVLSFAHTRNNHGYYRCRCVCGTEDAVRLDGLRSGRSQSCGCRPVDRVKDLVGQRYGKLTVTRFAGIDDKRSAKWDCVCDCGNVRSNISAASLRDGEVTRCAECRLADLREQAKDLLVAAEALEVDGIQVYRYTDQPYRNNTTGYRGVLAYGRHKNKYMAYIDVKKKRYRKYGYDTPKEAYYHGRLALEAEHLPEETL